MFANRLTILLVSVAFVAIAATALLTDAPSGQAQVPPTPTAAPALLPPVTPGNTPPLLVPPAIQGLDAQTSPCTVPPVPTLGQAPGGVTLRIPGFEVGLPAGGNYAFFLINLSSGAQLAICHIQTKSTVWIDAASGREARRAAGTAPGPALLDQIVAAVRPFTPPFRPPSTGSGGLR